MNNIREKLIKFKTDSNQIVCITCYDASFSKILDDLKIDIVLVGDSLGMVIQGENNTHDVKIEEVSYHTECVAKNKNNFILMSDMPKNSYQTSENALLNAKKLIKSKADIVKVEYKDEYKNIIKKLISENIPVCGHLGLLPQYVSQKEDIRVYGKNETESNIILEEAKALEKLGVDIVLLECVDKKLSEKITKALSIPVIGIGSGEFCDGQVQVLYDIIGISSNPPKFSKNYLLNTNSIPSAIEKFYKYVKNISII
tara:strand:- start:996 stop:1763 length:768 start_codon:yes stop_codon:yes gene_type:complete